MVDQEALVTAHTHPAELGHITLSELSKLVRNLGRLRRELSFVSQDITRITDYRKSIVYLLDFSELHTLLWPDDSASQYRHIMNYLLDQASLVFALPPGAIRELLFKLHGEIARQSDARTALEGLFNKPFVQAFMRAGGRSSKDTLPLPPETASRVLEVLVSFRRSNQSLDRLARLYEKGTLKHLSSIVDTSKVVPELDILHDAYIQLSAYRLGREDVVNYIDAHNYAFAYALNNKYYEPADTFFLLVTSSVRPYEIFENIKWRQDPLFAANPDHIIRTSLVRHPVQLLYHASLSQYGQGARQVIGDATKRLLSLYENLAKVPEYREYISRKDVAGSLPVTLPSKRSYKKLIRQFNETYQRLYRPLAEVLAVDTALEQNRRLIKGVSSASVSGLYPFDEAQQVGGDREAWPQLVSDYREALALYDRLINLATEEIRQDVLELKGYSEEAVGDVDQRGEIFPLQDLHLAGNNNSQLGCVEITAQVRTEPETALLWADRYETFTSFYWQTDVDLLEFIKIARHYVRAAALWQEEMGGAEAEVQRAKLYDGVSFFLDKGVKRFPLPRLDDLTGDSILGLFEPQWKVRYVRIGLPYGDLCYDFEPIGSLPQRAGLITHLKCHNAIADFVQWTHLKFVRRSVWRRIVRESMTKEFS